MASTDTRRSARLANKQKQRNGLFDKLSLIVVGECELAKKTHILLTRSNQHIQKIDRYFDVTLNNFCPMVFVSNQEK